MIYSVWNQGARQYDYYEAPGEQAKVNTPSPKHLRPSKLGLTVTQAAWPLPMSAVRRGSGPLARGRIASRGGGVALGGFDLMDPTFLLLLAGGFLFWRSRR